MARTTRVPQRIALAFSICTWLSAGCNSLLDINEPSKQVLESEAGVDEAGVDKPHDVGSRDGGPRDIEPPFASDAGEAPPPVRRDAGAPSSPGGGGSPGVDAGEQDSIYLWANWPMPNPLATSLPNAQGYTTIASGRVSDTVTHLEWQQFPENTSLNWKDAVAYCSNLMLDGVGGWRLPARIELLSLLDFSIPTPAIDKQTFTDAPAELFWSSSTFVGAPSSAWGVNFGFQNGFVFTGDMKDLHRVRCVR